MYLYTKINFSRKNFDEKCYIYILKFLPRNSSIGEMQFKLLFFLCN